jgi:UDP-N-acetyl-D-glucosamine dehydrogenase
VGRGRAVVRAWRDITVHDPVVGAERIHDRGFVAVDDTAALSAYDIAVILTDHDVIDLDAVASTAPSVFDTRNALRRRGLEYKHVTTL